MGFFKNVDLNAREQILKRRGEGATVKEVLYARSADKKHALTGGYKVVGYRDFKNNEIFF